MTLSKQIIGTVLFIAGVIACYQGALSQNLWLGPLVVGLIMLYDVSSQKEWIFQKIKLFALIGLGAAILESLLIFFSVYTVTETTRWFLPAPLLPLWIFSLWMNYAVRVPAYLPFFHGKHVANFSIGAVFGIIIFRLAERRELVDLEYGMISLMIIAMAWALYVMAIYQFAPRFYKQ